MFTNLSIPPKSLSSKSSETKNDKEELARQVLEVILQGGPSLKPGYSLALKPFVKFVSFDGVVLKCSVYVDQSMANAMGTLHGGCISTIADELTSVSIVLADRYGRGGVSVTLDTSYTLAPKVGETVIVETKVVKAGKNLSYSSATFLTSTNEVAATATHVKYLGPVPKL